MSTETSHTRKTLRRFSDIESFEIQLSELKEIKRQGKNIGQDFAFFMFWLPVGITATVSLLAIPIASIEVYCTYEIFAIAGYCFAVYFGIRHWLHRRSFEELIDQIINERRFGPAGDETREFRPSAVEASQLGPTGPKGPVPVPASRQPASPEWTMDVPRPEVVNPEPAQPVSEQK